VYTYYRTLTPLFLFSFKLLLLCFFSASSLLFHPLHCPPLFSHHKVEMKPKGGGGLLAANTGGKANLRKSVVEGAPAPAKKKGGFFSKKAKEEAASRPIVCSSVEDAIKHIEAGAVSLE
jgi:hypothetical protein